jgi:hypothetical protein
MNEIEPARQRRLTGWTEGRTAKMKDAVHSVSVQPPCLGSELAWEKSTTEALRSTETRDSGQ